MYRYLLFAVYHCDNMPPVQSGSYDSQSCTEDGRDYPDECVASCIIGHYMVGDSAFHCNATGGWNTTLFPNCYSKNQI